MDPIARTADPSILHPALRSIVLDSLLPALQADRLTAQLDLYETGRTPERQADLYARGRVTGRGPLGKTATGSHAWESRHQFGLAIDLVFRVGGKWTWLEPARGGWARFHQIAKSLGLEPLTGRNGRVLEWPHVQLPSNQIRLRAGEYPPGGDDTWAGWLNACASRWGAEPVVLASIQHPGAPPLVRLEEARPPLEDPACYLVG